MPIHSEVETLGFATIPNLISHEEIDLLQNELARDLSTRSRAGMRHAMRLPVVTKIASDERLVALAAQVLGASPLPYRATFFDKSPQANWLVVWHQDTALPLQKRDQSPDWKSWSVKDGILYAHAPATALSKVLALRLHLDDSDPDNGPLRVLPGSHTRGVLSDDDIDALVARTSPITCTVQRGGVIALRPLLVHASSKSQSDKPRQVLHIEYAPQPAFAGLRLAIA